MAILKKNAFSRRVPDLVTEELVAVLSRRASFEFKQLFDIVHEPRTLTVAERRAVATHPERGADVLAPIAHFHPQLAEAVLSHHERWDGTGYPRRLRGNRIPFAARVVSARGQALGRVPLGEPSAGAGGTIAFEVEDLDGLIAQLKSKGAKFLGDVVNGPKCRMITCLDSEGNSIILHQLNAKN